MSSNLSASSFTPSGTGGITATLHSIVNINASSVGGGTRTITFTNRGLYFVSIGPNHNDSNLHTSLILTHSGSSSPCRILTINNPGFGVTVASTTAGFTITSSAYPVGYHSFEVSYVILLCNINIMSCEISVDSLKLNGIIRRTIPIIQRYSSTNIAVPSAVNVLITSDTVNTSHSLGTTGFTYQNGLYRNTSGETLVCLVSYAILWNSVASSGRMSWIQMDETSTRYAMTCFQSTNRDPCSTASTIIVVPNNSYLRLWVFQTTGFELSCPATYGTPFLQICLI